MSCGRAANPDDRYCSGCGKPLDAADREPRSARPVLDEVFVHFRAGEQRPATILMADLTGYSALGEGADPEWVYHLINEVFGELVDSLLLHGAHIDKYVGDEIMALFGVPMAQEKSTERAVRAALAIRQRLSKLNLEDRFGGVVLGLHIGINVGPVMVGPVGHRAHADYTVIGDAVNVAKRLEEEAPDGQIYVSQAVRDAVPDLFDLEDMGLLSLAGRRQQTHAFRLLGARRRVSSPALLVESGVPFIGREGELRDLIRYAKKTLTGGHACVCVAGPPGIGKSRLIAEWKLSQDACFSGATVFIKCFAFGEHFPLLPLVDAVTQLAGLRFEGWPPRVVGDVEKAVSDLPVGLPGRARLIELLRCAESPPEEVDQRWHDELCEALVELIEGMSSQHPLCLIIEDTHWMDEASRAVLGRLLSQRHQWPLLVLTSDRRALSEEADAGERPTGEWYASLVRLGPLHRPEMERLVQAWAVPALLPGETVRAICDRAQGHPYFARELVRGLRHTVLTADGSSADASLPNTLQDLFLSQLDILPLPVRHLVQAAAVVGEPVSFPLLQAAMGGEFPLTPSLFDEATRRGLLYAGPAPGQFTYAQRLLFEAAYTTIPPTQRQSLHCRIATHLVENLDNLGRAAIHSTAHHAYLGYKDARAVEFLLRSARQYRSQYANRQAIRDASRALELISSLPKPEELLDQRLEALLLLSQSYEVLGDLERAEGTLLEADALAEDSTNAELAAKIITSTATLHLMQGQWAEAEQEFSRSHTAWEALGNQPRVGHALLGIGMCARQSGDRERALRFFQQAAHCGREALWVKAAALNNAGMILLGEGRYEDAECLLAEGLLANEEEGDRRGLAHCKASLGELYLKQGRFGEARRWLQESIREAQNIDDAECCVLATGFLSRVFVAEGQVETAWETLRQCEDVIQTIHDPNARAVVILASLEAQRATGEWKRVLNEVMTLHLSQADGLESTADYLTNVVAETLVLGLDIALTYHQQEEIAQLADTLTRLHPSISDVHLNERVSYLQAARKK
ncbi:MAG: hypothetical protein AUJ92_15805 [Armatimonadetes bacterium CG2_30_59_28]|nr:MAG: hypothetical protein AUJ92_15805 [Armatimonadetes bacterium CG2_30_59_28]